MRLSKDLLAAHAMAKPHSSIGTSSPILGGPTQVLATAPTIHFNINRKLYLEGVITQAPVLTYENSP